MMNLMNINLFSDPVEVDLSFYKILALNLKMIVVLYKDNSLTGIEEHVQ
jgi:hypothetical protein